ncbi:hypothetical protein PVT67_07700 [Gallaecimonas kandeliae]|uniref:hypothetical protein n=1 Tax=Gallaecimonas kandeliae TaxID=3029055 RepID=UPI002649FB20|nr:hypothetical protein [Gallaecimonas kandeliae]WKE67109.1 hypothetical protein PVT67_07700 [Gallaecimonas kandeliae]
MAMLTAMENFVNGFERDNLYSNFGPLVGQTLLDDFGTQLCKLGPADQPLNCFYLFITRVKFMPGNLYAQVNEVFSNYYQGALDYPG